MACVEHNPASSSNPQHRSFVIAKNVVCHASQAVLTNHAKQASCQQTWSWTAVLHQMRYSVFVPLIPSWCIIIEVESQHSSLQMIMQCRPPAGVCWWVSNLSRYNNTKQQRNTGSMILIYISHRGCPFNTGQHMPNVVPFQGPSWETCMSLPPHEGFSPS